MSMPPETKLKAIADPTRLKLLLLIHQNGEACVCQLVEALQMPQATVSKALTVLKKAGLVADCRNGQWMKYSLVKNDQSFPLIPILKWAAIQPEMSQLLSVMKKISKIPLEKICCNKPWRN